ncbi:interferon-gamma-inducible GTPase 10-like isoform X2 [Mytilus galloprovincialis]|uniref:interferon-gamma-inducible GTPase 10-like isoform X2 n=1 Tax=Mytilus galloprovincialis TaxID=29158 RepID=UPI003F7CC9FB
MNSSSNRNRKNCNGTIDGKACTKSLSCSIRFCSDCGKENPLYSTASAISASETDSNSKTGHNTDTSVSDDDEFEDAVDSQNIERHPLLRLNVNKPKEDYDVFDSSGDNEESDSGINREAYPDDDCRSNSTQLSSDQIMKNLTQMLIKNGPVETKRYINRMLYKWKKANVKIAITGGTNVGKSSFINMIRNVKPGKPGFAKSGSGNTTMEKTEYVDPKNSRILYCDCPGISLLMPREMFLDKVELASFDYILIFFKDVPSQDDAWLAGKIMDLNKPFCFVRSMLDQAIDNENYDKPVGKRKSDVEIVTEIREKAKSSMNKHKKIKNAKLFVISSRNNQLGEMSSCLKHLTATLSEGKYQAIMFALPVSSKQVIEDKYDELKKSIPSVAFKAGMACAATIFPGIGRFIVQNPIIKKEVQHYLKTFCLTEEDIKEIPVVLMNAHEPVMPVEYTEDIIIRHIMAITPIIGPAIEGGLRVKDILSRTLDSLKSLAYTVHKHCLEPKSAGEAETVL